MLTRRDLLRGMLAGAVAAVARISPLVEPLVEPRLTFRGIPIRVENPMWYHDSSGPLTTAQARDIIERMTAALERLPHKPGSYYIRMPRFLYREITGQEYEDRPS